ncbi:MAG: AbrB family transcriptional regulator, partial [Rhodobacteraceae bacterium]|nr:AbrB family transcriptional regulator [Paracoccaceae bacterium]
AGLRRAQASRLAPPGTGCDSVPPHSAGPMSRKPFLLYDHSPAQIGLALSLGLAGGLVAAWLGLPLPLLLGALLVIGIVAVLDWRPFGIRPAIPQKVRMATIPVIGVAIGSSLTPEVVAQMSGWLPSLALMVLFVPLAHAIGFVIYTWLGGVDRATAYFASMPGGLLEALEMGERHGADMAMLTLLQFLRLILCIVAVPIIFAFVLGGPVGSAAGVTLQGADLPVSLLDVALLLGAGILGAWGGIRLGVPAGILTGPLLLSGVLHATGMTHVPPPFWVIAIAQWIMGVGLGARFAGLPRSALPRAMGLAILSTGASLALAGGAALLLAGAITEKPQAVILAFAPGGVSEMSLVAISLQVGVVFVATHHLARIVLAIGVAQIFLRYVLPPPPPPPADKT